jgi:class 3 adenylate cyclase
VAGRAVERRIVTVLFVDLVGFTSLSERLDAEDVTIVQDAYFEAVREAVDRHGGLLEKFVGDAAMAVFGAPTGRDDDAERAVGAGLALVAAIERVGAQLGLEPGTLRLRVGIASGEAVYGEATAERGPVTGDTVNVAARLQAAAEPGTVVVGEVTALAVGEAVELESVGPLELKGKAEPVRAWRVAGFRAERSREAALGDLRAPMIGRDAELARLLGGVGGETRLVLVVAPPGVGKSRLLTELAAGAAGSGAAVLRAQLRPDLLSPFEPVGQLVRSAGLTDAAERLRAAGIGDARAAVVLEALEDVVAPAGAAPAEAVERDLLFDAWLAGLAALAGTAPSAWLVEDVHWASPDLLAFLAHATAAGGGRLVVATARPSLLESAPDWCATAELLHLAPLPPADVSELVHALVGDSLGPELVERIAERSGGNALFVEELLRAWIGTGVLSRDERGGWSLSADPEEVGLPPTVQAIYAAQLDDLAPAARTAARHASVAGRRFPLDSLAALAVTDGAEAVAALERRALVGEPRDEAALGRTLRFRHALLRDTAYASLARADRATLHLDFADWLGIRPPDALPALAEVIARHYAAAIETAPALAAAVGGRERAAIGAAAAEWFERASDVAAGVAAWESARALAERSLELTAETEPLLRAGRLERLARAAANSAGVAEAEAHARQALALYRGAGGPEGPAVRRGVATAAVLLARLLRAQTRFAESEQLADELLGELGEAEDEATARLLLMRGRAAMDAWDAHDRAGLDFGRALELARRLRDPDLELTSLELTTYLRAERGEPVDWGELERAARTARRWPAVVDAIRSAALERADDLPDAVPTLAAEAAALADAHGLVESVAWCDYALAEAGLSAGRWDDALASGLRAIAVAEERGFSRVIVRTWFVLLPIVHARGSDDLARRARPCFPPFGSAGPSDSTYARMMVTAVQLRLAAFGLEPSFTPELDWILPSFDLDHGGPSWLAGVETVVESWLGVGAHESAEIALDRMRARIGSEPSRRLGPAVESLLRARLRCAQGRHTDAAGEARHALDLLGDGAPWWRAKAIRVLQDAGAADERLLVLAASLESALGIARPARPGARRSRPYDPSEMIFCVIPRELADELYDKMVDYYKDNPNVTVIVDRREGPDRRGGHETPPVVKERRTVRDRRRWRPGRFLKTDPPESS